VQSADRIHNLTRALEPFQLTKTEKLQIINLRPTTMVEIYLVIEEFETRFPEKSDEIAAEIISLVKKWLVKNASGSPMIVLEGLKKQAHVPAPPVPQANQMRRKKSMSMQATSHPQASSHPQHPQHQEAHVDKLHKEDEMEVDLETQSMENLSDADNFDIESE